MCTTVIVQRHFSRNRVLASNIAMAGLSVGQILSPMIVYGLIEAYGWKWTIRLHAALLLNGVALAWLMYTPPNSPSKQTHPNKSGCEKLSDNFKGMWLMLKQDWNLVLKSSAQLFFVVTFYTLLVHTPSRAITLGIDIKWASFLLTVTGTCSLVAR
jgi:MFS family permease